MDQIKIRGGNPLKGSVRISGAKNAALPLMAACLLCDEPLILSNVPALVDIKTMSTLLEELGIGVTSKSPDGIGAKLTLTPSGNVATFAPYELVRRMRASVLVLGPLVAKNGEATVSLPGGCAIGTRPIDLHISGLEQLGAEIELQDGYVHATAEHGLKGATIHMPFVSVGATENLLMAATLAQGTTIIENAAKEPEIGNLAECLVAMGARITGVGSETLTIEGGSSLHGAECTVIPDRIEAGTFAVAAAITGGDLKIEGARTDHIGSVLEALDRAGVEIKDANGAPSISHPTGRCLGFDVVSSAYPGFPTDMQAQFMALMASANGASLITETIFENRFMHVPELSRMGADITVHGGSAMVRGDGELRGAEVMATDLRASVCLVLAGLAAHGETTINRVYHLDRGYERLEEKLRACGADIERVKGPD